MRLIYFWHLICFNIRKLVHIICATQGTKVYDEPMLYPVLVLWCITRVLPFRTPLAGIQVTDAPLWACGCTNLDKKWHCNTFFVGIITRWLEYFRLESALLRPNLVWKAASKCLCNFRPTQFSFQWACSINPTVSCRRASEQSLHGTSHVQQLCWNSGRYCRSGNIHVLKTQWQLVGNHQRPDDTCFNGI